MATGPPLYISTISAVTALLPVTLILLANSDGLSAAYGLSNGDVTTSLFAKLFLRLFVP